MYDIINNFKQARPHIRQVHVREETCDTLFYVIPQSHLIMNTIE